MKKCNLALCGLILSIPLALAIRTDYVVDDAFISFRYAKNLVRGLGLVFNPGERVEGYTNFLWTLLMTIPIKLGIDPLLFARVLSTAAALGTLVLITRFVRREAPTRSNSVCFVAPVILAAQASFTDWLLAGLEQHLFTFLLTAGLLSFLETDGEQRHRPGLWPVLLVLAALTRPEGLLFLVIAWILSLSVRGGEEPALDRRSAAMIFLPFLLLFVPYLVWKATYYGSLIPNTFYAKVGSGTSQAVRGLRYLTSYLLSGGYVLFLALPGLAFIQRRRSLLQKSLAFIIPFILYIILVGGDSMVSFRFFLPVLPLLALLTSILIIDVSTRLRSGRFRAAAIVCLTGFTVFLSFDGDRTLVERRREMVRDWIEVGRWLGTEYESDTSMALGAVGAIAYYSDLYTIDIFGLTDPSIAHRKIDTMGSGLPGHERADGAYVLSREPDLVLPKVVLTESAPPPEELGLLFSGSRAELEIWRHPAFRTGYRPVQVSLDRGILTYFIRARKN